MFGYLVDKAKSMSAVFLNNIKLYGVYNTYLAPATFATPNIRIHYNANTFIGQCTL